jgi:hypothetical protein
MTMTNKVWTLEEIIGLLNHNPKAVDQGITRLSDNLQEITESWEDRSLIARFDGYIQGLDDRGKPKWKGKSLSNPHSKIFIAQKHIDRPALEVGRDLCIKYAQVLTDLANGRIFYRRSLHLKTLKSGAYKDTVELVAMRKDIVLPEQKQFPLDITHIGEPTSEHYQMYAKDWPAARLEDPHSEDFFKETYFIVKRREHFLD